jgi:hypothetical protein
LSGASCDGTFTDTLEGDVTVLSGQNRISWAVALPGMWQ